MVDMFCNLIMNRIKKEMPEIDDEREEIINYGLQMIIGEVPKLIIMLVIAQLLKVLDLTIIAYFSLLPYKYYVGGVHAKSHIACMVSTPLIYSGNALISKRILYIPFIYKIIITIAIWIFSIYVITKYAPADTENVPILRKKERKFKKRMSYIIMSITLIIALLIHNNIVISNILIFGCFITSILITRPIYKLYNNKYGFEVYENYIDN